jgi:hypothetical protein
LSICRRNAGVRTRKFADANIYLIWCFRTRLIAGTTPLIAIRGAAEDLVGGRRVGAVFAILIQCPTGSAQRVRLAGCNCNRRGHRTGQERDRRRDGPRRQYRHRGRRLRYYSSLGTCCSHPIHRSQVKGCRRIGPTLERRLQKRETKALHELASRARAF